jgi:N-acetylglutamate synthase-like GNAT family acetyltransferase
MGNDALIIRKADVEDEEFIWQLLHAEAKQWDVDQIHINLAQLFVLAYGNKIIGVLCGMMPTAGKMEVVWIAAHPMFPENPVQIVLTQALSEIFIRYVNC